MFSLTPLRRAWLRALYPASCAACDGPLSDSAGLCRLCLESCEAIGTACPICARPIGGPRTMVCAPCSTSSSPLRSITACYEYGGQIAVALRRLKFGGRNDVARTLCPLLRPQFEKASAPCQLAIAMPLHPSRLRERGFNQAQRLLVPLAEARRLPIGRGTLRRTRATPPQSRLSRRERAANLERAFRASDAVAGKSVLLLDDIRTTGATLGAAARALRRAGAREIHGFVVARTEWEG